jgi:hypothetical protein
MRCPMSQVNWPLGQGEANANGVPETVEKATRFSGLVSLTGRASGSRHCEYRGAIG